MCAQTLFLVKPQPEGTGSKAVTGKYQCVPGTCMGCRLQDDRSKAKGERSSEHSWERCGQGGAGPG